MNLNNAHNPILWGWGCLKAGYCAPKRDLEMGFFFAPFTDKTYQVLHKRKKRYKQKLYLQIQIHSLLESAAKIIQ